MSWVYNPFTGKLESTGPQGPTGPAGPQGPEGPQGPAGANGATNLGATASPTGVTVTSDTGNDAVLPLADGTNAGLMAPAQHTKLDGVAAGATANATDAQLRDRATHTGTQAGSTVTGAYTSAGMTLATSRLLGRTSAGSGAAEEILVDGGLTLAAGSLSATLASQAEAEDATSTAVRAFSGQRVAQAIAANPRTIKGPHSYSAMLALPTTGFVAGATHVYCNSPAERIGIYVWDGTNYTKENASVVSAERAFGFKPGVDNTAAFAALTNWHKSLARGQHYTVVFGPGDFPADVIEFALPTDGLTPSLILEGVPQQTRFVARQSSHPVFMTVNAGFMWTLRLSGIELRGAGGENPNQDGLAIVGTPRPLDNVGGVTSWEWHELRVTNFAGQACWLRGSQRSTGTFGNRIPNQFGLMRNCWFDNPSGRHAFESIGQFGQVNIENGVFDGGDRTTTAGAGMVLSVDYRFQAPTPIYVDTGSGLLASNDVYYWPHGTPCRVIGSGLPGGLSKGTTYWAWQGNIDGTNESVGAFFVASSLANCGSQTPVTLTTTGTYGSYSFVALWATALSSNTFTTNLPHKLITGDRIRLVGSNLPTGVSLSTDYYVIRVDHLNWKLASSEANAAAGTAISISGGTLNDYGFVTNNGTVSDLQGAYSVNVLDATIQIRRQGVFVANGNDINLRLHVENLVRSFHFVESVALVDGGSFLSSAKDSGKGVWLTAAGSTCRVGVTGMPSFSDPPDKLYCILAGATVETDITQPSLMNGAWPATQTTGGTLSINAAATIDIGASRRVSVNTSATQITTITSQHTQGQRITLAASGGSIVLATGGNISMATSPLTIPQNGTVTLERWNSAATWSVVGVSAPGPVTTSGLTMASARLLGRTTASSGAVEEISIGSGLSMTSGTLSATASGGGTKTLAVFTPMTAQPTATNFATLDTRNSIAVLDFDAAAVEGTSWVGVIPEGANLSSGITVRIWWMATSATSGNVRWRAKWEKTGTDMDADSYDTATEATGAANGTSGIETVTSITCTAIDSLAAGDRFRLAIERVGNDATNDTMTGDAELVAVEIRQVA